MREREAIVHARETIGVDPNTPACAFRVRRLDREDEFYYLLVFGEPTCAIAVAAVNGTTGDLESWARLPGTRGYLQIDATEAELLSGLAGPAGVEMVWKPCRASRSQLYPVWEVRAEETIYVDQSGKVWREL